MDYPSASSSYFYLTVAKRDTVCRSYATDEEEKDAPISTLDVNDSPLHVISKQYHNVKWKGCKLQVALAKLHFLQKLQLERDQAKNTVSLKVIPPLLSSHQNGTISTNKEAIVVSTKLKRHLKIRQQYGLEAFRVDSKPIETKNWRDMFHAYRHQRKVRDLILQKEKIMGEDKDESDEKVKSLASQSRLNRSIRISFTPHDEESDVQIGNEDSGKYIGISDDNLNCGRETGITNTNKNYVWSDEDSDDNLSVIKKNQEVEGPPLTDDSREEEQEFADIFSIDKQQQMVQTKYHDSNRDEYSWSDNDDCEVPLDSSDTYDSFQILSECQKSSHSNPSNEFASEMDAITTEEAIQPDDIYEDGQSLITNDVSLLDDVRKNLSILQQMKINNYVHVKDHDEFGTSHHDKNKSKGSGWDIQGMIQRYDPSLDVSDNFVKERISEEDHACVAQDMKEIPILDTSGSSGNEDERMNINSENAEEAVALLEKDNIYEEAKLKDVFQQPKNEGDILLTTETDDKQNNSQSFLFSFNLECDDNKASLKPRKSERVEELINLSSDENSSNIDKTKKKEVVARISVSEKAFVMSKPKNQRQGFRFQEHVLDAYVQEFFNLNEGEQVMQDWESMRKDLSSQEQWRQERKVLSYDWSAKYKLAVSKRTNKRMKYSRLL